MRILLFQPVFQPLHGRTGVLTALQVNLLHLLRVEVFNIEDKTIFTFGGGESTDKDIRAEKGLYWKEELPTPKEMAMGAAKLDEVGLEVDYIITHEPPKNVKSAMLLRKGNRDRVNKLNGYLEEIGKSVDFKHWYFGSLHMDKFISTSHICLFNNIINAKTGELLTR